MREAGNHGGSIGGTSSTDAQPEMLPRVSPGLTCLTAVRLAAVALGSVFPAMLRLAGRDGNSSPAATAAGQTRGARCMLDVIG
ncbi:hypothetical protein Srubr_22450 [Streptomyces rubradiris]|uniref:Uncharacterized protein n=1 Tax=Streptomyces rubradiris TaxID=285531 RepID=A0ABQ3R959_STRRR|nr:hypothetical protein GCM10018792_13000 [Streptomyces rubradiris]GHI52399.1 hypothetical protein Srubr_22450 [Streptomyces rubradiris]